MDGNYSIVIVIYLICHIPAFIMLFLGLRRIYSRPDSAKRLLIAAGIYFIIGGGICSSMIS